MLTEAGFEVEKSIAPGLPPVIADADALNQCLENLISNAIKYGRPGRWLSIQASSSSEASGTEVQASVEDHGAGIPSADLPHVFEPFFRTKAAREGQIWGVGLGLHLVSRMMQGMGGRVSVWSKPGHGSKFTLHLPALPLDES
jgi:signal transduction histidine kinase